MQQGLRPYVQDENALAAVHRPAALSSLKSGNDDSENARSFAVKGAGGFPTVRKALGNLTNSSASLGGGAAEGALLGKTPGGAALVRRALGDITNSKAAAQSAQKAVQKAVPLSSQPVPALLQQQQQEQKQGQQMPSAAAASVSSRADALAAGGVERIAGRSWEQLEAARLASEDAEISERLAALASFPCRALPTFFPSWGMPASLHQSQGLQKDILPSLPSSPVAEQLAWPGSGGIDDITLPEVDLLDVGDAEDLLPFLDGF